MTVEVLGISRPGFWLLVGEQELFVPFEQFPWFRDASVAQILNVECPHPHHLYWPDLDVDLAVESIEHPERFPLVCRERPEKTEPRKKRKSSGGTRHGSSRRST